MKRQTLASGVVVIAALGMLTATAVAAVAPGKYKGNLYQANGAKIARLRELLPNLFVLGGCCGTDRRHVGEICTAWLATA